MTIKADAFRYGVLIGLREAGCTEKVAYEILDELEASRYDLEAFTTPAHVKVAGRLGAVKGFIQGATGWGAKGIKQTMRQNRGKVRDADRIAKGMGYTIPAEQRAASLSKGVPAGFQSGAKVNKWMGKHPVVAGGIGAGGMMLGSRVLGGADASASDLQQLREATSGGMEAMNAQRQQDMRNMMMMMQMMQGGGGGIPPWYNPRAIYGR